MNLVSLVKIVQGRDDMRSHAKSAQNRLQAVKRHLAAGCTGPWLDLQIDAVLAHLEAIYLDSNHKKL